MLPKCDHDPFCLDCATELFRLKADLGPLRESADTFDGRLRSLSSQVHQFARYLRYDSKRPIDSQLGVVVEEVAELMQAVANRHLGQTFDAGLDVMVAACTLMRRLDLPVTEGLRRVMTSNATKSPGATKGPGYVGPVLADLMPLQSESPFYVTPQPVKVGGIVDDPDDAAAAAEEEEEGA